MQIVMKDGKIYETAKVTFGPYRITFVGPEIAWFSEKGKTEFIKVWIEEIKEIIE